MIATIIGDGLILRRRHLTVNYNGIRGLGDTTVGRFRQKQQRNQKERADCVLHGAYNLRLILAACRFFPQKYKKKNSLFTMHKVSSFFLSQAQKASGCLYELSGW